MSDESTGLSRRKILASSAVAALGLSAPFVLVRGDIRLINFTPNAHTVELLVKEVDGDVVFDETYDMESGELIAETGVLGWNKYYMDVTVDGGRGVDNTNTFPRPYCLNPQYEIMMHEGYYAGFELTCS